MSVVTEQVKRLRELADDFSSRDNMYADAMRSAADTIEMLSEKARPSGWIPCKERMPENGERVLVSMEMDYIDIMYHHGRGYWIGERLKIFDEYRILAWRPLSEAYREEG